MSTENLTSFVNQYRNVALKALGFDPAKGTITKDEAVSFVDKYFPNITRGFKPTESQFSTYLTNTILKVVLKQQVLMILELNKLLQILKLYLYKKI